jgi:GH24 family phage-related lysozyme (muramidase)
MRTIQSAEGLIGFDEGDKGQPYQDSRKIWTVGVGHNLEANGLPPGIFADAPKGLPWPDCLSFLQIRGGLKPDEDAALFRHDIEVNGNWLLAKPWWLGTVPPRQAALMDMAFNLGPESMQTFTTFLGLCASGDWDAAANDLEFKTKVATELPARYGRLESILRTGEWPTV